MKSNSQNEAIEIKIACKNKEEAIRISSHLINEKLVACAQMFAIESMYHWKGEIVNDQEILIQCKSITGHFEKICSSVKNLHSYEVPEIICLPLMDGHKPYLDWIRETTQIIQN